jgi:DNA polymerase elongation subunit (family B)
MPKTDNRILCEDYCKQFPDMKDLTLARKVYDENKKQFKSVEAARNFIRKIRGHHGKHSRKTTADKTLHKPITYDTRNQQTEKIQTSARILILDIETAPVRAYVWQAWKQNVQPNQIVSDWFVLTWAAKWLFEDMVYSGAVTSREAVRQDDKRIMKSLWGLLNEADIVIAHNGIDFDIPKINTRFLLHGFMPPLPYVVIDTLKHIRKQFAFTHNKLDYVNQLLELPRKVSHEGMEMWDKCYRGDQEALDKMLEYNVGDVRILEDTYLRIRPWIKPHPNLALHILDESQSVCPQCGSNHLTEEGKHYHTSVNIYELLRCGNCGATARKRLTALTIKQRRHLLTPIAR